MNPDEYDIMASAEDELWWYCGLRGSLTALLDRYGKGLSDNPIILDAGCGTGANLRCLSNYFSNAQLGGFDLNLTSLHYTRLKNRDADIYESDICSPELHHEAYDLITSMDVIYMVGIDESLDGLKKMAGSLKPNGLFITNTPAMRWLYSEHDRAVHTKERHHVRDMRELAGHLGLEVLHISYRCFYLFPLIILSRLSTMFGRAPETTRATSDVSLPHPLINSLFTGVMKLENWGLSRGARYPWGSSVILVARKPD